MDDFPALIIIPSGNGFALREKQGEMLPSTPYAVAESRASLKDKVNRWAMKQEVQSKASVKETPK